MSLGKNKLKKTTQLKQMLQSPNLEFIMEAHSALSAQIVEEAGFKGIWASGLSISASLGVRDSNEASWTQVLEVLEFMSDKTNIPILMDADTGYGNFNNVRRLVRKVEQREIGGVCLEDKLFPKTNSFINSEVQPLADISEFCGKIKAAKDTQEDNDFIVVARTEAFIAGWGLQEALKRSEAYRQAGADAVLIHSAKPNFNEIEAFLKEWGNRLPVVIVPTKYYSTPTEKFIENKVSLAIWANHNLRASVSAMQAVCKQIYDEQTLINVEEEVASLGEIFRLQGADELKEAEKIYSPTSERNVNAIILADTQGKNLGDCTDEIPKALIEVQGKPVITTQIDSFHKMGVKDISIVRGFAKDKLKIMSVKNIDNDDYENNGKLYSLYLARKEIKEDTVISFGDILFKNYILHSLLMDENPITLIVDADFYMDETLSKCYVKTSEPYSKKLFTRSVGFVNMFNSNKTENTNGEFIGLWKVNKKGAEIVKKVLEEMSKRPDFKTLSLIDLFNEVSKKEAIKVRYIKGDWLDIYTILDLKKANANIELQDSQQMLEMNENFDEKKMEELKKLWNKDNKDVNYLSLFRNSKILQFLNNVPKNMMENSTFKQILENIPEDFIKETQKHYVSLFNLKRMNKYFTHINNPFNFWTGSDNSQKKDKE